MKKRKLSYELPTEILLEIFKYISITVIKSCKQVCRQWHDVLQLPECWIDKVDWYYISTKKHSEQFLRKYFEYMNKNEIIKNNILSKDFLYDYRFKFDWWIVSLYQPFNEEEIKKFKNFVHWWFVIYKNNLSEQFIKDNLINIVKNDISIHYRLQMSLDEIMEKKYENIIRNKQKFLEILDVCKLLDNMNIKYYLHPFDLYIYKSDKNIQISFGIDVEKYLWNERQVYAELKIYSYITNPIYEKYLIKDYKDCIIKIMQTI